MNNVQLTPTQREELGEAIKIAWYHFGHHRECYPSEGCDCGAEDLRRRLGAFDIKKHQPHHDGAALDLLRALPAYVGHSWRCPSHACAGCHYPRLIELGAGLGVTFDRLSWSAWWCDTCERFFHSRPANRDGSCTNQGRCEAYRSVIKDLKIQVPGVPF